MSFVEKSTELAEKCKGKWPDILKLVLDEKHHNDVLNPGRCPKCGKDDLYFVANKEADHAIRCRKCNLNLFNGIRVASAFSDLKGNSLLESIVKAESSSKVTVDEHAIPPQSDFGLDEFMFIDTNCIPILDKGAELGLEYFTSRGIDVNNKNVQRAFEGTTYFVEDMSYYHKDKKSKEVTKGNFPAIVFRVHNLSGFHIAWHKIFLDPLTAGKAKVPDAKKIGNLVYKGQLSSEGKVIPFGQYGVRMGAAEGPETSLALIELGMNCNCMLDKNGLVKFDPPNECEIYDLFGDYDLSGVGQKAIVERHAQLDIKRPKLQVNLWLPPARLYERGSKSLDFLDLLYGHKVGKFHVHEFTQMGYTS